MKVKIFQLTDVEWVAAETEEEAWKVLADMIGPEIVEEYKSEAGEVILLSPTEMESHKFTDGEMGEGGETRTFQAQLENMIKEGKTFPCYFATSEW